METLKARVEFNMERGASKFCSEWILADTEIIVLCGWVTLQIWMPYTFFIIEEIQWEDNGCVYKLYNMSEMPH